MTLTFPVSKSNLRDVLKEARAIGERCLEEFKDANAKGKRDYCVNWGDLHLSYVELVLDEDADMAIRFNYEEGQCHVFEALMYERLKEAIPGDYSVEVKIEW